MCHRVSDVKTVVALCYLFKVAPERRFVLSRVRSAMGIYVASPCLRQPVLAQFAERAADMNRRQARRIANMFLVQSTLSKNLSRKMRCPRAAGSKSVGA